MKEKIVKSYKELIFKEDKTFNDAYQISISLNNEIKENVVLMLIECDKVLDSGEISPYDLELTHSENPSNPFFVADYEDKADIFEDENLLERIRFAIISIENFLHSGEGGCNIWKYEE